MAKKDNTPLVIGGAVAAGFGAWWLMRRRADAQPPVMVPQPQPAPATDIPLPPPIQPPVPAPPYVPPPVQTHQITADCTPGGPMEILTSDNLGGVPAANQGGVGLERELIDRMNAGASYAVAFQPMTDALGELCGFVVHSFKGDPTPFALAREQGWMTGAEMPWVTRNPDGSLFYIWEPL